MFTSKANAIISECYGIQTTTNTGVYVSFSLFIQVSLRYGLHGKFLMSTLRVYSSSTLVTVFFSVFVWTDVVNFLQFILLTKGHF